MISISYLVLSIVWFAYSSLLGQGKRRSSEPPPQENPKKTMEKKVEDLVEKENDVKKVMAFIRQYQHMRDDFTHLVELLHERKFKEDQEKFARQLQDVKMTGTSLNFFCLIEGPKATVKVYEDQLKELTATDMTGQRETKTEILKNVRTFWKKATDASLSFGVWLVRANALRPLAADVKNLKGRYSESETFRCIVEILHSCARNTQLSAFFQQYGLVPLLKHALKSSDDNDLKLLVLLTLSYITPSERRHDLLADNENVNFLLDCLARRVTLSISLTTLLQGLCSLAQNCGNKTLLVVEKDILEYLKPILENGSDQEKLETLKVVLELTFWDESLSQMREDTKLIELLKALKDSSDKTLVGHAKRALVFLTQVPAQETVVATTKRQIMISYTFEDKETVLKIYDGLRREGFSVWMKEKKEKTMIEDDASLVAVQRSSVVLLCMSRSYTDNLDCKAEAEYALKLKKDIIPLKIKDDCTTTGWLSVYFACQIVFTKSVDSELPKLVVELKENENARKLQTFLMKERNLLDMVREKKQQTVGERLEADHVEDQAKICQILVGTLEKSTHLEEARSHREELDDNCPQVQTGDVDKTLQELTDEQEELVKDLKDRGETLWQCARDRRSERGVIQRVKEWFLRVEERQNDTIREDCTWLKTYIDEYKALEEEAKELAPLVDNTLKARQALKDKLQDNDIPSLEEQETILQDKFKGAHIKVKRRIESMESTLTSRQLQDATNWMEDTKMGLITAATVNHSQEWKNRLAEKDDLMAELSDKVESLRERGQHDLAKTILRLNSQHRELSNLLEGAKESTWSPSDVSDWITRNQLNNCPMLSTLSFETLKFLKTMKREAPDYFFTHLTTHLRLTSLDDLKRFCDALSTLPQNV